MLMLGGGAEVLLPSGGGDGPPGKLLAEAGRQDRPAVEAVGSSTPKKLSGRVTAEIVARYEAGETVRDIARALHLARGTVSVHLSKAQVGRRPRSMTEEQINQAVVLYEQGFSLARVGEQLGFTAWTILRALRDRGVAIRDTHGRPR